MGDQRFNKRLKDHSLIINFTSSSFAKFGTNRLLVCRLGQVLAAINEKYVLVTVHARVTAFDKQELHDRDINVWLILRIINHGLALKKL